MANKYLAKLTLIPEPYEDFESNLITFHKLQSSNPYISATFFYTLSHQQPTFNHLDCSMASLKILYLMNSSQLYQSNWSKIYNTFYKTPQMGPCEYWSDNYSCRTTPLRENVDAYKHQSQLHTLESYPPTPKLSALTLYASMCERLYSCVIEYPNHLSRHSSSEKWTKNLDQRQQN